LPEALHIEYHLLMAEISGTIYYNKLFGAVKKPIFGKKKLCGR